MAAAHFHLLALCTANANSFFVTVYLSTGYGLCIGHSAVKQNRKLSLSVCGRSLRPVLSKQKK